MNPRRIALPLAAASLLSPSAFAGQISAKQLIERSLVAMGGRDRLAAIRSTTVKAIGHINHVEQSERPTGPFIVSYDQWDGSAAFDTLTVEAQHQLTGLIYGGTAKRSSKFVRGVSERPGSPQEAAESVERLMLGPERVMLLAEQAKDARVGAPTRFQDTEHLPLTFTWGEIPVRVLVNLHTGLPTAVETTQQLTGFFAIWGDSTTRTIWGNWDLRPGGIIFPLQWTREINGIPVGDTTILSATFEAGGTPTLMQPLARPADIDPKRIFDGYKRNQVAPGVTQFAGGFNTVVIDQGDGLVVLEPVWSSGFASYFLDRLRELYPDKRVKAVIPSTDAWPHFGGLRSFVARGIDVYALDANRPIYNRLLSASHKIAPDELQRSPRKARVHSVSAKATLGSGPNRVEIYPIRGEGSERMLMVYLPERKLLYGSDLLQPQRDGFFFPAYPAELVQAVARERLDVREVLAMHAPTMPWEKVTDFVNRIRRGG